MKLLDFVKRNNLEQNDNGRMTLRKENQSTVLWKNLLLMFASQNSSGPFVICNLLCKSITKVLVNKISLPIIRLFQKCPAKNDGFS